MINCILKNFAAVRWSQNDKKILREVFMKSRDQHIPHNVIYQFLAKKLDRTFRAIKYQLERMYHTDPILSMYKYDSWDRKKIVNMLVQLYTEGHSMNRVSLPRKVRFQIANHSLPKSESRGFETWFNDFDSAVAEAIYTVGFQRNEEGKIDHEHPITSIVDAKWYYRRNEKKTHMWNKDEVIRLFQMAHEAGLPLTHQFFAKHYDIYKPLLGVNRSLEGLKTTLKTLGWTWGNAVMKAVPEYQQWYDETGTALRSTGEVRVQRFLDLNNISYRIPSSKDRIAVTHSILIERGYQNFVPDLYILDDMGTDIALVEVFGSVADSEAANGDLAESYREKIEAKIITYRALPIAFIMIHDNTLFGNELDDHSLQQKFHKYLRDSKEETNGIVQWE